MATTFKVLGNGTPVLSMTKWVRKPRIEEEDIDKEWNEVKGKYTNVSQEEFELQQKQFQEM